MVRLKKYSGYSKISTISTTFAFLRGLEGENFHRTLYPFFVLFCIFPLCILLVCHQHLPWIGPEF